MARQQPAADLRIAARRAGGIGEIAGDRVELQPNLLAGWLWEERTPEEQFLAARTIRGAGRTLVGLLEPLRPCARHVVLDHQYEQRAVFAGRCLRVGDGVS